MSESQSEIEEAFSQCLNIIDNPPAEHRIAKHAIQGAILLSIHRKDLISKIYFKLLQVVKDAQTYRLNPRVCAVREISYLTYHDEQLAPPAIQFLQSLLPCDDFNSQQISRAAVVSLSRIARMHVVYQPNVIQTIRQIYQNSSKKFLRAEALIGIARMSQRNHSLRTEFASEFIKCAHDKNEHIKCAAISALSHAVVALENVPRDEGLEQRCFEICSAQLRTAPRTEHTRYESDWHLVHLSAIKALALLVRAAPSTWWTPVAQVFERVLADPREPWLSKCGVVWMSGKLSALFAAECQDYKLTRHLLLEAVKHDHTMLVESAVHGLVHLSLAHTAQYSETRDWIKSKLGTSFKHTSGMTLALYLRPWCKLIARAVNPLFQALTARMEPLVARSYSTQLTIKAPEQVDEDMRRSVREPEPVVEKTFKLDVRHMEQTVRPIARDDQQLWRVCSEFSASVLESLVAMLRDMTLLDDQQLVQHVKLLILDYKNKVQQSKAAPDPALHLHYKELAQMDLLARETAVTILRFPQVLDDAHWLGSVKQKFTAPQHHQSRAHSTPSQRGGYPMQHGVSTMQSAPPALVPPPLPFNPPGPVQQQQQQQLLQLLSLTNPALLMQLNAHNNAALLQTLQQQAVLTALQQNALTNPARDPRLNTAVYAPAPYAAGPYQPAPYQPPEQYNNNTRGSYNNNRGRGAHRGRGGTDQGYKRPRDDVYQGPDSKRAKYSHSASQPPTGPSSVNGVPGSSNSVNGAPSGPDQSESGSAAPRAFTELSSNTSAQTTPELEATVPPPESVNHVPHVKQEIESDVVTLGSDSEEEQQMTGVKSSSESDSDDEEGEISSEGDASGLPGPGVQSVNASSARKKRKRKKKGKKKASNEREVCKYFVTKNSCSKGQDCPYLHPAGHKLDEVCRFYRSGVCRRGDECIYSHDLSREACKHMVQGACLYGDRCRFSHDPAVVEAQRLITPPSHKTRVKQAEPVSSAPVVTPLNSQVLHPISALPVVPFVAQQRDPRLDPSLTSQLSLTNSIAPPATTPVRTASPEPLSTPFGLSLLTTLTPTQSTPRSNVADELKKLL